LAERADLQEPGGCGGSRLAKRTDQQEPGRLWMSVEGDGEKTMRRRKRRGKKGPTKIQLAKGGRREKGGKIGLAKGGRKGAKRAGRKRGEKRREGKNCEGREVKKNTVYRSVNSVRCSRLAEAGDLECAERPEGRKQKEVEKGQK